MNVFCSLLLSTQLLTAASPTFTAQTIDGRQVRGALTGWDAQTLVLRQGDREERFALDQLLSLIPIEETYPKQTSANAWITLTDGSLIAAESYAAEPHQIQVTTGRLGVMILPPASVERVRFQASSGKRTERWHEILKKKSDRDVLVISSGESLDYLEGVVRGVSSDKIEFDLDGDVLPVRRSKVFGIHYYRASPPEATQPLARLTDDDGSTWAIRKVALSDSTPPLSAETVLGIPIALPLDAIGRIEFAGSGLVYLSDLTPESYQWTPYFGSATSVPSLAKLYRPRANTTFDSQPIVLDGISYSHGLALHSRTEMTYRLNEPFKRFQATAGIDDHLRPRGNVNLRILGDDRILFDSTIAGTDPAQSIDISLGDITTLTIVADFGSDLDVGDHLILAEAKLLK